MHRKPDPVAAAIETAMATAYYEGRSFVIYLLNLALFAAREDAERAVKSPKKPTRS